MNWFRHVERCAGCGWFSALALAGLCCNAPGINAQTKSPAWEAAVEARSAFEAEPAGTHTAREYTAVMDNFRAIYHSNPGAAHAARSVEQVAELLSEEGKEFNQPKSLRDAVGQYEFLAKAYPGGKLAPDALHHALLLLPPEDVAEKERLKAQLEEDYPAYRPASDPEPRPQDSETASPSASDASIRPASTSPIERTTFAPAEKPQTGSLSILNGIRHWSTASYTRVAIDLEVPGNEDVKYQAARVENPDRIFFDLHHTRLAPQLAGKSFNVTDDGFLTKIRAAQFSDDTTRVVLDVHGIADYSAFLLPNPYRLIIDIHRKPGAASPETATLISPTPTSIPSEDHPHTPLEPQTTAQHIEMSNLPPMPVTDGSAGFGLPVRKAGKPRSETTVARLRVVIPSKSTAAVPVPNTITDASADTSFEVAAVSKQDGKVQATPAPTSRPISSSAGEHQVLHEEVASNIEEKAVGIPHRNRQTRGPRHVGVSSYEFTAPEPDAPTPMPAPLTADGEPSLTRTLGLKIGRIVIDAGHGGHDSGTLGVGGIEEKDIVLDVALRLGKLLHDRLGAEVVYTRASDTFIPLETRTAIANKAQADLFISVHANSSRDESARGVEVYYLNFTSDPEAMRVASRENAVSTESVHELSDLVKKIALKDKIDESRELASDIDTSLYAGLRRGSPGLKDRGVKKAPFVVLIGANMPSVLAEISFVTNSQDAAKLSSPEYRQRVAESLYAGIARYAEGINGRLPRTLPIEQAQR